MNSSSDIQAEAVDQGQSPDTDGRTDSRDESADQRRRQRRADVFCLLLLFGLSIGLWAPRMRGPIDLRFDAGVYYVTGTALAEGKGYSLLNEPGDVAAVQYPPLLPAIVAVHQKVLGTSDPEVVGGWLRWTYFGIFTAYLLAAYVLSRIYLRPMMALAAAAIAGLFILSYYLSDLLFTEIPFALASVLFILCNRRSHRPAGFAATALLGVAAYLLRSAGAALLAAWLAEALVQRRWKQLALRTAVVLIPVLGWQLYISGVTHSSEYTDPPYPYQRAAYQYYNVPYVQNILLVDPFRPEQGSISLPGLAARVAYHVLIIPPRLGEVTSTKIEFWEWVFWDLKFKLGLPKLSIWVAQLPLTIFGLIVIAGALVLVRWREWFIPLYIGATIGVVALTPWPSQFARYLTPIAPLLSLCMVLALESFRRYMSTSGAWFGGDWRRRGFPLHDDSAAESIRQRRSWRHVGLAALIVVISGSLLMQTYTLARTFRSRPGDGLDAYREGGARLFYYDETWHAYAEALRWVDEHAEPADVVAVSIPHWAYLKTNLKTIMPPMEDDPATAQAYLDAVPVRWLVIDEVVDVDTARIYGRPVIERYPQTWQLMLVLEHAGPKYKGRVETHVYRRVEADEPSAAEPERRSLSASVGGPASSRAVGEVDVEDESR